MEAFYLGTSLEATSLIVFLETSSLRSSLKAFSDGIFFKTLNWKTSMEAPSECVGLLKVSKLGASIEVAKNVVFFHKSYFFICSFLSSSLLIMLE